MKKKLISLIYIIFTLSTITIANDIKNNLINYPNQGFYIGGSYGITSLKINAKKYESYESYDSLMAQIGYKYNKYLAFEGRYWSGFHTNAYKNETFEVVSHGLYLKPTYPTTPNLSFYSILGVGDSVIIFNDQKSGTDYTDLSYGVGVSYFVNQNILIFSDYIKLYNDNLLIENTNVTTDIELLNFGVTYQF